MSLRETISSISKGYPVYLQKKTNDKSDPIHSLVTKNFPNQIKQIIGSGNSHITKGSTGATNITYAPWIAAFDPLITKTATDGYYVVYLFSTDLKRLYLSIGIGVTKFEKYYGDNKKMRQKVLEAAGLLADQIRASAQTLYSEKGALTYGKTDLNATTKTKLHRNYEYGNIVALEYDLSNLPGEEALAHDLNNFISLYSELARHPLTPTNEQLLEVSVEEAKTFEVTEKLFNPRERTKRKTGSNPRKPHRRRSSESIKTGNRGEEVVFQYEKGNLLSHGKPELAEKVDWIAKRGVYHGYDILSFTPEGEEKYIEVKSSVGKKIDTLEITENEWAAAQNSLKRKNYYIYLVTDVFKNPHLEVLRNPAEAVQNKEIEIAPSVWRIDLREPK